MRLNVVLGSLMTAKLSAPLLSIIITNYNYGLYVGAAISSALAVRQLPVEVIVIDDGSTDCSRAVIDSFGNAITSIFQLNKSQVAACNTAFAASHGEIVIFLDADDMLDPAVGEEIAVAWNPFISKVQFQMQRIDPDGIALGEPFPPFEPLPSPKQIRSWFLSTSAYPTPPGSGNAYARWFLCQIFPLDPKVDRAADSFCLSAAPLLGDVVTIAKPLASYRIHGKNLSMNTNFSMQVRRAKQRLRYACLIASKNGIVLNEDCLLKSLETTQFRAASIRFSAKCHPILEDSRTRVAYNALWALLFYSQSKLRLRAVLVIWTLSVLYFPRPLAKLLVSLRFRKYVLPAARAKLGANSAPAALIPEL